MDSTIFNSIAIVVGVIVTGVALKIWRKVFAKSSSFVYRGSEPLDNSFNSHEQAKILPGQTIPSRSLFQMLKSLFFSGKGCAESLIDDHKRLGKFFASPDFVGHGPAMLNVADAEAIRKIVISSVEYFPKAFVELPAKSRELFGPTNVVFNNGEEWKHQRSALNAAFYDISRYIDTFHKTTLDAFELIEKERAQRPDSSIIQHDVLMKLTLDVLGRSIFKVEFGCLRGETTKEVDAYLYAFNNTLNFTDILMPFWHKLPTPGNHKFFESTATVRALLDKLISDAKAKMKKAEESHQSIPIEELTILEQMMQNGLSDQELKDNAIILFIAGHETSANGLAVTMGHLATNPRVQQKLYETICEQIGADGVKDVEKLSNCQYLDFVMKEALRMHGPVSIIAPRQLTKDESLNGIIVPKGTIINISVGAVHHSEEYWQNPDEFRPERFLPEETKGRPTMAFLPFGAGKRVCLGMQFAMVEMKCFIAALLLKYRLEPVAGFEKVKAKVGGVQIQSIQSGFRVRIVPRE